MTGLQQARKCNVCERPMLLGQKERHLMCSPLMTCCDTPEDLVPDKVKHAKQHAEVGTTDDTYYKQWVAENVTPIIGDKPAERQGRLLDERDHKYLPSPGYEIWKANKPWLTPGYLSYLRSSEWKKRRKQALEWAGYQCQHCGDVSVGLHAHHVNYERLGEELQRDLLVLCEMCHDAEHRRLDAEREAQWEEDRYDARVVGYATKRWGEDWAAWHDWDEVYEQFEQFIERQGDE